MRPGPPAICPGTVMHHRFAPADHRFTYPVTHVWIDPDHPEALFGAHPLWSSRRPAPVRFRRRDYLDGGDAPLGPAVRRALVPALGREPTGPLRMLTQPRTWGWLFNPITIHLAWDAPAGDTGGDPPGPVAALLEVTNTPWKERHLYPVALQAADDGAERYEATFDKTLHVSPFLDEDHRYHLTVASAPGRARPGATAPAERRVVVTLDVLAGGSPATGASPGAGADAGRQAGVRRIHEAGGVETIDNSPDGRLVLTTRLVIDQYPVERALLTQALRHNPLPTHRVSLGIHHQAWRLWRRGVPFVPHPRRRAAASAEAGSAVGAR